VKPQLFLSSLIRPGLAVLADAAALRVQSPEAEVLLLAIATQESALRARWQGGKVDTNLARGFWQFEKNGGLAGILGHNRTVYPLRAFATALTLPADLDSLWAALPYCDLLQVGAARLLLWSDSQPLPHVGAKDAAWDCYIRNWRPGKPSRMRWDAAYDGAVEVCREGTALDVSEPTEPSAILDHIEHSLTALRRAIA
jgi:hypothetical protein